MPSMQIDLIQTLNDDWACITGRGHQIWILIANKPLPVLSKQLPKQSQPNRHLAWHISHVWVCEVMSSGSQLVLVGQDNVTLPILHYSWWHTADMPPNTSMTFISSVSSTTITITTISDWLSVPFGHAVQCNYVRHAISLHLDWFRLFPFDSISATQQMITWREVDPSANHHQCRERVGVDGI